jgi:hypothetical protein
LRRQQQSWHRQRQRNVLPRGGATTRHRLRHRHHSETNIQFSGSQQHLHQILYTGEGGAELNTIKFSLLRCRKTPTLSSGSGTILQRLGTA